ncbi:hypothetical protein [Bosea sp. FBZP-16]|uniref:hypothetical protein n=1 Tax=Bosea sp. FBZP-16 TaxID=2065382 RepID=UPI001319EF0C|nr:hypothetical protein [Bosea sp. FBZP-16]
MSGMLRTYRLTAVGKRGKRVAPDRFAVFFAGCRPAPVGALSEIEKAACRANQSDKSD